jgi:enamine deaminase RidA (YjgF/YER057c/UK114 family)
MTRRLISSGSPFEREVGYSRAVVEGDWVFVSGTTGFDYRTMTISDDPAEQARQIFRTLSAVLEEAGSSLADVVRARFMATSVEAWEQAIPVIGAHFRDIRPASTATICGLVDPRMKLEIEVTAKKRG